MTVDYNTIASGKFQEAKELFHQNEPTRFLALTRALELMEESLKYARMANLKPTDTFRNLKYRITEELVTCVEMEVNDWKSKYDGREQEIFYDGKSVPEITILIDRCTLAHELTGDHNLLALASDLGQYRAKRATP